MVERSGHKWIDEDEVWDFDDYVNEKGDPYTNGHDVTTNPVTKKKAVLVPKKLGTLQRHQGTDAELTKTLDNGALLLEC